MNTENRKKHPSDTHHHKLPDPVSVLSPLTLPKSYTPGSSVHTIIYIPLACTSQLLVHTHHTDMLYRSSDHYTRCLWVKLSERNSLWLSLFFTCAFRQLLWWWDTKTALAANVHMSGKSMELVSMCKCVCLNDSSLCVLNNIADNAVKSFLGWFTNQVGLMCVLLPAQHKAG